MQHVGHFLKILCFPYFDSMFSCRNRSKSHKAEQKKRKTYKQSKVYQTGINHLTRYISINLYNYVHHL